MTNQAKAIRIDAHGGPEVLKLQTVEVPAPAQGEVTIRQKAAGLNFIDIYFRTGLYPHPLPHGLGFEAAGDVVAVGEGVTHLKVGDRVAYGQSPLGAYADLVIDDAGASLQARRADGRLVALDGLSDGTRDQLYLALRLAALELYLDNARPMPFIADDLFINYDDARTLAGLRELSDISRRTQVVFLTHHAHMVELARDHLAERIQIVEL